MIPDAPLELRQRRSRSRWSAGPWAAGGGAQGAPLAAPESEDERAIYLPQIVLKNPKKRPEDTGQSVGGRSHNPPGSPGVARPDSSPPRGEFAHEKKVATKSNSAIGRRSSKTIGTTSARQQARRAVMADGIVRRHAALQPGAPPRPKAQPPHPRMAVLILGLS